MSDGDVDEVHGAATSVRTPGFFAVQFGDHSIEVAAFGQVLPVASVGSEDRVPIAEMRANSGGDGLLSDTEVDRRFHFVLRVEALDTKFDVPGSEHIAVEFVQRVAFNFHA